jgi:hypothetical protein
MDTPGLPLVIVTAQNSYPGLDGFLGARGSLMLDAVVVAMLLVLPVLAVSIWLVKVRRQYQTHKTLQLALAGVLLATVLLFEIDIRVNGWEERAEPSPYFDTASKWTCAAGISLIVHLSFAVPTLLLWIFVVAQALRRFPSPPRPGPHSPWHARTGWLAAGGMGLTAVTGWLFYWLAFVAT